MVRHLEILNSLRLRLRTVTSCSGEKFLLHFRCSSTSVKKEPDLATKLKIEEKWTVKVTESAGFEEGSDKEKCYICPMFPYPSGNLHMGHVRVYTISDAIARFQRLNGKNVLHPIGFDSFGLPAENAAIQNKVDPEDWTNWNISKMRKQLKQLGVSFDWSRELTTSNPEYYKFTQYLFLLMYKHGLVYRKKSWVNWDPVDNTVLADEQVDENGKSWRSGAKVEKKLLKQWFIRATNFAESLKNGLERDELAEWRDIVKLQKHWIGECNGAEFAFDLYCNKVKLSTRRIWVEKPEHICNAAFVAVCDLSEFALTDADVSEATFFNPFTKTHLPLVVVPEEELTYPEGCTVKLCIPSQDDMDAEVARKENIDFDSKAQVDNFDERVRICRLAVSAGIGGYLKSSKLCDWLISRQRRWGTPIPIVHCASCGPVPVKFEDLPVVVPKHHGSSSSAPCPNCGQPAVRETDTMDTFVDSSWYFLRYIDPLNTKIPFDPKKVTSLMPVDIYIGGKEHATLHLYYARFVSHFLHSIGLVPTEEPFKRLLVQGMVMGQTYYVKKTKRVLSASEVAEKEGKLIDSQSGEEVIVKWEKMSKSKHNGVEPSDVLERFGVDTTRLLILGEVSPTSDRLWKEEASLGIINFQDRIWKLLDNFLEARRISSAQSSETTKTENCAESEDKLWDIRNFHVRGITFNYSQTYQLSVAISKMQGLVKSLQKFDKQIMAGSIEFEKALTSLLIMLAPMAPHFASELWSKLQSAPGRLQSTAIEWDQPVLSQKWPKLDDEYLLDVVFKVNSSVKGEMKIPFRDFRNLSKDIALEMALAHNQVVNFLDGREVLAAELSLFAAHSATLNITVDHTLQKRKTQVRASS